MNKPVLMTLIGVVLAAVMVFAPAANAGYHHHHHHYKPHYSSYVYVSDCKWVKFHDHYGHYFYKKVCH